MSKTESLQALENLLESFLDKAVALKENRLTVLNGLNRLDDIARQGPESPAMADEVGDWMAEHVDWLNSAAMRTDDVDRMKEILGDISQEMESPGLESMETLKIRSELERWQSTLPAEPKIPRPVGAGQKIVLRKGPEPTEEIDTGSITVFTEKLKFLMGLWEGASSGRKHVLSALDDLLKSAYLQHNQDALLLSGFVIYYLRQNGYLVEPYVKRLKAAESLIKKGEKTS